MEYTYCTNLVLRLLKIVGFNLTPPPVYLSHRVLSSHGWTILHILTLIPLHAPRMGLAKPNKWVSLILLLDCAYLINTRPNAKEYP